MTLDRADKRNALTIDMARCLADALHEAGADPEVKVVVLEATGSVFCAGADLAMVADLTRMSGEDVVARVYGVFQRLVRTIVDLPVPVVAVLSGPALGAGCDLALACDMRLVTRGAGFEETWVRLGLVPGMGGMALLAPLVGLSAARDMIYRAIRVDGERALEMGLADAWIGEDTPDPDLLKAWLAPLLQADRGALVALKRGTRRAALRDLDENLEYAAMAQALRLQSAEVVARFAR